MTNGTPCNSTTAPLSPPPLTTWLPFTTEAPTAPPPTTTLPPPTTEVPATTTAPATAVTTIAPTTLPPATTPPSTAPPNCAFGTPFSCNAAVNGTCSLLPLGFNCPCSDAGISPTVYILEPPVLTLPVTSSERIEGQAFFATCNSRATFWPNLVFKWNIWPAGGNADSKMSLSSGTNVFYIGPGALTVGARYVVRLEVSEPINGLLSSANFTIAAVAPPPSMQFIGGDREVYQRAPLLLALLIDDPFLQPNTVLWSCCVVDDASRQCTGYCADPLSSLRDFSTATLNIAAPAAGFPVAHMQLIARYKDLRAAVFINTTSRVVPEVLVFQPTGVLRVDQALTIAGTAKDVAIAQWQWTLNGRPAGCFQQGPVCILKADTLAAGVPLVAALTATTADGSHGTGSVTFTPVAPLHPGDCRAYSSDAVIVAGSSQVRIDALQWASSTGEPLRYRFGYLDDGLNPILLSAYFASEPYTFVTAPLLSAFVTVGDRVVLATFFVEVGTPSDDNAGRAFCHPIPVATFLLQESQHDFMAGLQQQVAAAAAAGTIGGMMVPGSMLLVASESLAPADRAVLAGRLLVNVSTAVATQNAAPRLSVTERTVAIRLVDSAMAIALAAAGATPGGGVAPATVSGALSILAAALTPAAAVADAFDASTASGVGVVLGLLATLAHQSGQLSALPAATATTGAAAAPAVVPVAVTAQRQQVLDAEALLALAYSRAMSPGLSKAATANGTALFVDRRFGFGLAQLTLSATACLLSSTDPAGDGAALAGTAVFVGNATSLAASGINGASLVRSVMSERLVNDLSDPTLGPGAAPFGSLIDLRIMQETSSDGQQVAPAALPPVARPIGTLAFNVTAAVAAATRGAGSPAAAAPPLGGARRRSLLTAGNTTTSNATAVPPPPPTATSVPVTGSMPAAGPTSTPAPAAASAALPPLPVLLRCATWGGGRWGVGDTAAVTAAADGSLLASCPVASPGVLGLVAYAINATKPPQTPAPVVVNATYAPTVYIVPSRDNSVLSLTIAFSTIGGLIAVVLAAVGVMHWHAAKTAHAVSALAAAAALVAKQPLLAADTELHLMGGGAPRGIGGGPLAAAAGGSVPRAVGGGVGAASSFASDAVSPALWDFDGSASGGPRRGGGSSGDTSPFIRFVPPQLFPPPGLQRFVIDAELELLVPADGSPPRRIVPSTADPTPWL